MTDGGEDFNLGHVVGSAGEKGDNGSTVWNTSTAPTYANSKYTFTISNLSGKTGLQIAVNDIIFYSTYYYIVSAVNTNTVDCSTRVSIKGSDASVTIVDNLTSDSSTSVLSAKQGKVLNTNKIETSAIATSFGSTTSDSKVPSEKLVKTELDKKIATSNTAGLVKNDGTIDTTSYSTFSGSYNDLTNKPSIPSSSSDLSDGSNLIKKSSTTGLIKNDGSIDSNSYLTTSSASSTYQTKLVSGTSIKTINNESLLGSGNITIQGGSSVDIVTAWEQTLSDAKVPSEKLAKTSLDGKVDKVTGKGLSTNDFTNSYKSAIDGLSTVASSGSYNDLSNKPTIPSISGLEETANKVTSWSTTTTHTHYPSEKLVKASLDTKANSSSLSTVATSGSYADLSNKPSIPSSSSDLSDGSDLVKKSSTTGLLKNDGSVDATSYSTFSGSYTDLSNKPSIPSSSNDLSDGSSLVKTSSTTGLLKNDGTVMTSGTGSSNYSAGNHTHSGYVSATKVTSWSGTVSDSNVPSEKLVKDSLDGKLDNALSSTAVTVASDDDILITDYSDSNKVKRVANILSSQMKDPNMYVWIGTSENATQETINSMIDSGFNDVFTIISNKVSKSSTSGLLKSDGSVDTSAYITSSAISGMLTTSDVANNLTTTSSGKVLDARQGKALADLIGDAITYINQ